MVAYLMSCFIVLSCILVGTDSLNMVPIPYAYPVQVPDVPQEPATIVIRNSGRRPASGSSGRK